MKSTQNLLYGITYKDTALVPIWLALSVRLSDSPMPPAALAGLRPARRAEFMPDLRGFAPQIWHKLCLSQDFRVRLDTAFLYLLYSWQHKTVTGARKF